MAKNRRQTRLASLREFLDKDVVKVLLSILIIASVLPENALTRTASRQLSLAFFFVFAFEFAIRAAVYYQAGRERKARLGEGLLLALDLIATLSFLPVEYLYPPAKGLKTLRLVRFMRMFLLIRYWAPVAKEVWVILVKRKFQLMFVGSVVLILSFVGGALMSNLHEIEADGGVALTGVAGGFDYNEDGKIDERDHSFGTTVWWAFRQLEDPGNLVREPRAGVLLVISFLLTIGGVFVVSFLIGIGTNVVEELVNAARGRPLGMRDHSALLNPSPSAHLLLNELLRYYHKHLRKARIAVLGRDKNRPDYLFRPELGRVRYRSGNPWVVQDLRKVDTERASRVILLGNPEDPDSDASIVSQILSVRQLNPEGTILAELYGEGNLGAAVEAGGGRIYPIPMTRFASLLLSNIVLYPGIEEMYRELLTSAGQEIYTVLFGEKSVCGLSPGSVRPTRWADLVSIGCAHYGVVLLGFMILPDGPGIATTADLVPVLNPDPEHVISTDIMGIIGLSTGFEELKRLGVDFATGMLPDPAPPPPVEGTVPSLELCPDSCGIEKIVISNFREGLVEFVEQLILFLRRPQIHIMTATEEEVGDVVEQFLSHSMRRIARRVKVPGHFERHDGRVVYRFLDTDEPLVPVEVVPGDILDERQYMDETVGGFRLPDIDMIVFSPRYGHRDPDARTVLGVLKLWDMLKQRPDLFRPNFRMVAEVSDPEIGELLEQRAATWSPAGASTRSCTVISRERARNEFIAQAIFVPGIAGIYEQLLSETGEDICRLLFQPGDQPPPGATVTFRQLLYLLYQRDRLILLGVELHDRTSGTRTFHLNPRPGDDGFVFRLDDVVSVCAVGDTRVLAGRRQKEEP